MSDGRPTSEYILVSAETALYDGGLGKGATVKMYADKLFGEGRLERTVPVAFSSFDGLDVGLDRGAPVDFTYMPPFPFTGSLDRVIRHLQ